MNKFSKIFVTLCLMTAPVWVVSAQETELKEEPKIWSLEDCLQYGLKNHPKVVMADSDVKSAEASLLSAKGGFDPRISASTNWGNSKQRKTYNAKRINEDGTISTVVEGKKSDSHSESVSISQKIYDFGRSSLQIKQARESLKAAKKNRETALIELASNIKTMYFKAQQAQCMLQVKLDTLAGYERHLDKVESFVEVGTHAPYDITKAQVDVANARVDLISAKNNLNQALVNVGNAIGIEGPIHIAAYEVQTLPELDENAKVEFVKIALERPDVKAAESNVKSARFSVREAKCSLKPTISSNAGYSWNGTSTPQNNGWSVGLGVSWQIFDGRNTKASINRAQSSYERSKASLDNLKLNIDKEVENAVNDIVSDVQRVKAYEYVVRQASESLNLAEGRYDAGLSSPLEVTDARVDYEKAEGNFISAYFDCLIAQTTLDSILGKMPPEYGLNNAVEELHDNVTIEEDLEKKSDKLDIEFEAAE